MSGLNTLLGRWEWPINVWAIRMSARDFKEGLLGMDFEQLPIGGGEGESEKEDHSDCGLVILKYEVMTYSFNDEEEELPIPMERFGRLRYDVEAEMLPWWKRMGFWRADFARWLEDDKESEGDGEYPEPMSDGWEPREEYESEGFEEDSSRDGDDNDEDGDDETKVGEGNV